MRAATTRDEAVDQLVEVGRPAVNAVVHLHPQHAVLVDALA
jgi:hypothetical protein